MSVPKATVHKDHGIKPLQVKIRFPWEVLAVESKPESPLVKVTPNGEFDLGVLPSNP